MCSGSASQCDVPPGRQAGARQHRREQRRHAVEDRRPVAGEPREHGVGRRPLGHQYRGRSEGHRVGQRVAESVREEQLRGREHDVVLADADDGPAVQVSGVDQARVDVHRAFRGAGRSGRVEPERDLVARGRRRVVAPGRLREQRGKIVPAGRGVRTAAGDQHVPQVRKLAEERGEHRQQRGRDDEHAGATVAQHELVVGGRQQRVDRHRHDPRLDRAKEGNREVDAVVEAK
jgi:hypothetical protein